jgi:hypothetical protein
MNSALAIVAGLFISWVATDYFTIPWIVVGAALATLIVWVVLRRFWQTGGADVWVIDARESRIERTGELVVNFAQMQCVQVTQLPDHGDNSYRYVLAIKKRSGDSLVLTHIGSSSEEMLQLAHLIGKYAQLPVETHLWINSPQNANQQ